MGFFSSGAGLVLCGDTWLQLERKGDISFITKPFIAIFIVNILLWIDFNISMVRRKKHNEPQTSRLRCVKKGSNWLFHTFELLAVLMCHQAIGGIPGDDGGTPR